MGPEIRKKSTKYRKNTTTTHNWYMLSWQLRPEPRSRPKLEIMEQKVKFRTEEFMGYTASCHGVGQTVMNHILVKNVDSSRASIWVNAKWSFQWSRPKGLSHIEEFKQEEDGILVSRARSLSLSGPEIVTVAHINQVGQTFIFLSLSQKVDVNSKILCVLMLQTMLESYARKVKKR